MRVLALRVTIIRSARVEAAKGSTAWRMRSQGGLSLRSDCLSGANRSTLGQHCFALPRHTEKFLSNVFILGGEQPSHALESARLSE